MTNDDPSTIDLPGVGEVALGDEVSVGGGIVRSESSVGGATIPAYCDTGQVWLAS